MQELDDEKAKRMQQQMMHELDRPPMTVSELIDELNEIIRLHPNAATMRVAVLDDYSRDTSLIKGSGEIEKYQNEYYVSFSSF